MDTEMCRQWTGKATVFVVGVCLSAAITLLFLAALAFGMLRMELSSNIENIGLICTSVISCFAGGFFCGKKNEKKGFLWGLAVGVLYYIGILALRTMVGENEADIWRYVTTFLYCCGSGMLGGMLS